MHVICTELHDSARIDRQLIGRCGRQGDPGTFRQYLSLDDDILMELKYPSLEEFIKNNFDLEDQNQLEQSFDLIASCIESVYTADDVWTTADCTKKEIIEFLEQMNSRQFKEIEKFFTTMPKLSHEVKVTNPKTKVKSTVILEGLSSFFA